MNPDGVRHPYYLQQAPHEEVHMRPSMKFVIPFAVAAVTLSACGSGSEAVPTGANKGGEPKVTITSPADGASVQTPFLLKWDSTVPLGSPDTGKDHVHVFIDGNTNDYAVVGGTQFQIKDLKPGKHKIEISLQRADHSPVGPKSVTTVTVGGGSSPSTGDSGGGGYGY
jgi:Family of unknown function (DUF6130)